MKQKEFKKELEKFEKAVNESLKKIYKKNFPEFETPKINIKVAESESTVSTGRKEND